MAGNGPPRAPSDDGEGMESAMFRDLTIRARILLSFAAVLVIMIAMGAIAYRQLTTVGVRSNEIQTDAMPGLLASSQLSATRVERYALIERRLRLTDPEALRETDARLVVNRNAIDQAMKAYEETIHKADDRANFNAYKQLVTQYRVEEDALLEAAHSGRDVQASQARFETMFARV